MREYAYTSIRLMLEYCQRCGRPMQEVHQVATVRADGIRLSLGAVRSCRNCNSDSWLFRSDMPACEKTRWQAAKTVL